MGKVTLHFWTPLTLCKQGVLEGCIECNFDVLHTFMYDQKCKLAFRYVSSFWYEIEMQACIFQVLVFCGERYLKM